MEDREISYFEKIEEYLKRDFFDTSDKKISFLLGRYYNYLASLEKSELYTTSLYTKMPMYVNRLDREQLLKILDKCNSVFKRLVSKRKTSSSFGSNYRDKIHDLFSKEVWKSSYEELSLAFMMGFSFYYKKETKIENEEQNEVN